MREQDGRNISVIRDEDGNKIVVINDILFKGKRSVNWDDVREYLKQFVGEVYQIAETKDMIYIGTDLPGCRCIMKKNWSDIIYLKHDY